MLMWGKGPGLGQSRSCLATDSHGPHEAWRWTICRGQGTSVTEHILCTSSQSLKLVLHPALEKQVGDWKQEVKCAGSRHRTEDLIHQPTCPQALPDSSVSEMKLKSIRDTLLWFLKKFRHIPHTLRGAKSFTLGSCFTFKDLTPVFLWKMIENCKPDWKEWQQKLNGEFHMY